MFEIGSIVYLKSGSRKVMIINRGPIVKDGKYFDYSGCVYPIGVVMDEIFYFNEENIDTVLFRGFHDEEEDRFQVLYKEWKEQSKCVKANISMYKREENEIKERY